MTPVRLRRTRTGTYRTDDGRFTVRRLVSRQGESSWGVYRHAYSPHYFRTLREAREYVRGCYGETT